MIDEALCRFFKYIFNYSTAQTKLNTISICCRDSNAENEFYEELLKSMPVMKEYLRRLDECVALVKDLDLFQTSTYDQQGENGFLTSLKFVCFVSYMNIKWVIFLQELQCAPNMKFEKNSEANCFCYLQAIEKFRKLNLTSLANAYFCRVMMKTKLHCCAATYIISCMCLAIYLQSVFILHCCFYHFITFIHLLHNKIPSLKCEVPVSIIGWWIQ